MLPLGRAIRKWVREYGPGPAVTRAMEAVESGEIDRKQISIGGLAEGILGPSFVRSITKPVHALEANEAVDVSAFSNITGQLLVTEVREAYESPDFVGKSLVKVIPEPNPVNLYEFLIPGVSNPLDGPSQLAPGMPYPHTRVVEDWVSLPAIGKFGEILNITLEAVLSDRTGRINDMARSLGRRGGLFEDEQILKVVLGLVNNHKWKGTVYSTYQAGPAPWSNSLSGKSLASANWQVVNDVEQLFAKMLDPYTNKPIEINVTDILVMPDRYWDMKRILFATGTNTGNITASPGIQTVSMNPIDKSYKLVKSKIARRLLIESGVTDTNAADYAFWGEFNRAFAYREVLAPEVIAAPPGNPADFDQDIVMRIKFRFMGAAGVLDPRYTAKTINA